MPTNPTDTQPHVVVFIADDLGVDYAPCYASDSPMTFLKSQCDNAAVFTQAYTHPVCTPSRAAMMTGRHTFRTGSNDVFIRAPKLPLSEVTIPEKAKELGSPYRFSAFGKWHLASNQNGSNDNPNLQGFDHYEGTPRQTGTYDYWNYDWIVNGQSTGETSVYKTTQIANALIADFERVSKDKPQFIWGGFVNPHLPYHAPPTELHSQGELPIKTFKHTGRAEPQEGEFRINHRQPQVDVYFVAMLEALDTEIGRIANRLTASSDRPIIFVFLGDNGTAPEVYKGDGLGDFRAKATLYQGGVHVPMMVWSTDDSIKSGPIDDLVELADLFPTFMDILAPNPTLLDSENIIDGQSFWTQVSRQTEPLPSRDYSYFERGVKRGGGTAFAWGAIDQSGFKLVLHETDKTARYSPGTYVEIFDTNPDPFERDNLYDLPCEVDQAKIMDIFNFIDQKFTSEPTPRTPFNSAFYRDLLDNMKTSCP